MELSIYYGEKGKGKTHYIKELSTDSAYFTGTALNDVKTFGVIESMLNGGKKTYNGNENKIYAKLKKYLKSKQTVIIDNAECVSSAEFNLLANCAKDKNLIVVFNLKNPDIYLNANYKTLVEELKTPDKFIEYEADDETLKRWLKENYAGIYAEEYARILKLTDKNFNNIKRLMAYKVNKNDNTGYIGEDICRDYVTNEIDIIYRKLEEEMKSTLQQSAVIGETFNVNPLMHPKGFHQLNAENHIKELEKMKFFIQSNVNKTDDYDFIDTEVHNAIFSKITSEVKTEWLNVLINYYFAILEDETDAERKLDNLSRLLKINEKLNFAMNQDDLITVYLYIIRIYVEFGDNVKLLEKSTELFKNLNGNHSGLKQFLFGFSIKNYINVGGFEELSKIFDGIKSYSFFNGSNIYVEYYKAQAYYNCGRVDEALAITRGLLAILKKYQSDSNIQNIHALVYSFAATLWNHLGIEDGGYKYYNLALKISDNKLIDRTIHYGILKNCDMLLDRKFSIDKLKACCEFYESRNMLFNLGEVSMNLGTEMLFSSGSAESKKYLEKAEEIFSVYPNEKYAYSKNNAALYYLMAENNSEKTLAKLNEALIIGLSDFTYMTIYQNVCACYILLGKTDSAEFKTAYDNFSNSVDGLLKRENASRYEEIYRTILDLIISEHTNPDAEFCERCLNSIERAPDTFFKDIIYDIYARNTNKEASIRDSDKFYFDTLNAKKVFLTEFRFWE